MASTWIGVFIIGLLAGLIARMLSSDPRNPQGCLLTTFLGIVGAATFTWIGQFAGLYEKGEYAGFIGAVIGSVIVLGIWRALVGNK